MKYVFITSIGQQRRRNERCTFTFSYEKDGENAMQEEKDAAEAAAYKYGKKTRQRDRSNLKTLMEPPSTNGSSRAV